MQTAKHKPLYRLLMTGLLVYGLGSLLFNLFPGAPYHRVAGNGFGIEAPHSAKPATPHKNGVGSADACIVWDCGKGVSIQSWRREHGLTINRALSGYGEVCQSWAQCD